MGEKPHQHHEHCDHNHSHNHDHNHSHDHDHGHHHHHEVKNFNKIFFIGISLNTIFVIVEVLYGVWSNSLALIADAGHNLSDVFGLALAWLAFWFSKKKPSEKFTYGYRRSSILSALANAMLLLIAVGAIAWEALRRFQSISEVQSQTVMLVSFIGILINGFTAYLFMADQKHDLNLKGAYLHMLADALISAGVLISGFIIFKTQADWIDPLISIVISLIIVYGTWSMLTHSFRLALDAVPENINYSSVKKYFTEIKGIEQVHDLHIWALSTTETALTVHLILPLQLHGDAFLARIHQDLKTQFKINHATIQLEVGDVSIFDCALKSDDVI